MLWIFLPPFNCYFINEPTEIYYNVKKDKMKASELLELTKQNHSAWSIPRARLKEKGIIDVKTRGMVSIKGVVGKASYVLIYKNSCSNQ